MILTKKLKTLVRNLLEYTEYHHDIPSKQVRIVRAGLKRSLKLFYHCS